jgi:heme exporter protein B
MVDSPSVSTALKAVVLTDLKLMMRNKQDVLNTCLFFVLVLLMFPLGVDPGVEFLSGSASGLIWVAFLLSVMLSINSMFRVDFEDGTIEQWFVSGQPVFLLVLAKVITHWMVTGLPLLVLTPLLAVMLHMPAELIPVLLLSLLLGTPVITLIGGIGAALTVSLRGGSALLFLLVLPLMAPVLIFATGSVQAALSGLAYAPVLALLAIMLIFALMVCPFAISAALRMSQDN